MIKMNTEMYISNCVKDLITGGSYELLINDVMNKSKMVFKDMYNHIEKQDKGEPDFKSLSGKEVYDVKLFLDTPRGRDLCSNRRNIEDYSNWIRKVINELNDCLLDPNKTNILNTSAYKILKDKIDETKEYENFIAFFTFPINSDLYDSALNYFTDSLSILYDALKDKFVSRKLFFIVPTLDGYIELRDAKEDIREFMKCDVFNDYFNIKILQYHMV